LSEPGEGNVREAEKARRRVPVATWRGPTNALQRKPVGLIDPGEGNFDEVEETRRRVAVATCRGRDNGFVERTEAGEASVQLVLAFPFGELRRDAGGDAQASLAS
jgi:hypothetical protein